MSKATKQVEGRRQLHYDDLEAVRLDAQELSAGEVEVLGNWSFGQIMKHIAVAMNATIDGFGFRAPWPIRFLSRTFFKKRFLRATTPAGYKVPNKFPAAQPDETSVEEGLAALNEAIDRLQATDERQPHPFMGELTKEESDTFQLRHAELHMSFVRPKS